MGTERRRGRWALAALPMVLLIALAALPARAQFQGFRWQPEQASSHAARLDVLFDVMLVVAGIIAGSVCLTIVAFCFKYRRGKKADRTHAPSGYLPLELAWTGIPILLSIGAFLWGATLYFDLYRPPANALTIYVVGKQWMWKVQHLEGRREVNELHLPVGRPIRLVLTSQDVIHDFYVPAFRTKQDAVPGRYTEEWFTPTRPGRYHLFCAQYCGTDHSKMTGWVFVMPPDAYARWLTQGSPDTPMVAAGEHLFTQYGCSGCHGPSSTVHAPSLVGIYGKSVPIQNRQFALADDRYLHDSIVLPGAQIAAGYANVMPSYRGQLTEDQILQIIAYIRSLGGAAADRALPPDSRDALRNSAAAAASARGAANQPGTARSVRQASGSAGTPVPKRRPTR